MHYQSDGTQVTTRPAPAAVTGTPGYVQPGNPVTGQVATDIDPDLTNAVMDELNGIVIAAGLTPDKTNNAQVLVALAILMQVQPASYFASATLTAPAWANAVEFEMVGPGGSSGGASGTGSASSGAGGAAYVAGTVTGLIPASTIAYTHGLPGAPGAPGQNGSPGTNSTFGPIATAAAGQPGYGATGGLSTNVGLGGVATIGSAPNGGTILDYFLRNGDSGGAPFVAGSSYVSGNGGGAEKAAGTFPVVSSSTAAINGFCNPGKGVGACGAVAGGGGGGGSQGYLRVRWRRM